MKFLLNYKRESGLIILIKITTHYKYMRSGSNTHELSVKLISTPSEGINPIRKLVDTLLQNFQTHHRKNY